MGLVILLSAGCARLREAPPADALVLAENGRSDYVIVIPAEASPSTRYAAEELQYFIDAMSGATVPIKRDTAKVAKHEIILGNSVHLKEIGETVDFEALGDEGYVLRTAGPHLIIAGGPVRGAMYGVYGLLEDYLGCRWFTPDVSRIPRYSRLAVPALDETTIPVLESREPFTIDCFDGDWNARNRMNGNSARLEEHHGGKVRFGGGLWVHTFNTLVPPDKYFDEHPEYFSEIDGKRVKDRSQLCCTNEDVIRICIEEVKKHIKQDPGGTAYSVSQNDWFSYCRCANCQALAEREDTQMAPVLYLVNRVAEAIEEEFPGKAIETLAYQWTRKPPKTMRPRPNVIIRLCTIECCFMHPLDGCELKANTSFVRDIEGWAKVANRLWIWDYVTSFSHYFVPFPNLRVRDDNIQLFVNNNVTGIFEQDVYTTSTGELSPLSGYLNAKLLWDPWYNEDTAINEFLEGVYGDAAKPIRKYIDLLHDKVEKDNIHARIWLGPNEAGFLDDKILAKSHRLWDKAEAAASRESAEADAPATLERVGVARLSVDYASIERLRAAGGLDAYDLDHKAFHIEPKPEIARMSERFFDRARGAKVTILDEWGRNPLDKYEEDIHAALLREPVTLTPLEPVGAAGAVPGLAYAYYEGTWDKLPDFASLTPVKQGATDPHHAFRRNMAGESKAYALRYTGCITVPRDGVYAFLTESDDGSRLTIGDTVVVDNDGVHTNKKELGFIALKAGPHPITLDYFQAGDGSSLSLTYAGPRINLQEVPPTVLSHTPEEATTGPGERLGTDTVFPETK